MPLLWSEARCDGLFDPDSKRCQEGAPGAYGVKNARKAAKGAGFRVTGDEWLCPVCYKRRQKDARATPSLSEIRSAPNDAG